MPLHFHSNQDEGLTTINGDGPVTWDCLHQVLQDLLDSGEAQRSLPHIIDLREAEVDFSSTTMDPFGEFFAVRFGSEVTGSIAIVIKDGLAADDCAMFYKVASSVDHTELFDDYNHAMRWLMRREFANVPQVAVSAP
jgi:hypothetical protein